MQKASPWLATVALAASLLPVRLGLTVEKRLQLLIKSHNRSLKGWVDRYIEEHP